MADPKHQPIIDVSRIRSACSGCTVKELCLPFGIDEDDLRALEQVIRRRRPLARDAHVYREGDPFSSLYAVRSGAIKTYTVSSDGVEHVTGFHLPGELVGLDAINAGYHRCSARALDTTSLCEVPFDELEQVAGRVRGLQRQLVRLMSQEIHEDEAMLMLLSKKSADERLAAFLAGLSNRFERLGYSPREFNLSMSRHDIANYLGLAVETISRLFTRFQEQGLVTAHNRYVRVDDLEGLRQLARGERDADVE